MNIENWLNTELGIKIWENKYRYNNESLDQWFDRVSGNNKDIKQLIKDHKFLFGGRTLNNRGLNNGSYSNCYSSGYVEDSLEEIMKVNTNLAFTYKAEGGQGVSLSKIRPKGCLIGGRYESDGIVPFMEMFNVTTSSLKQGGCISENSRVLTNKGYIPIKDIKIGDKAWTKLGWIDINYLFDKGEQEVFEVITKKGYRIETTSDHKYCIDAFNSKKLSDLSIGDKINLISGNTLGLDQYLNSGEKVSEEIGYFIGYLNGNGWISDNQKYGQLTMHWDQIEIKNKLIDIIKFLGFDTYVSDYKENSYLRLHISQELISWLSTNNLFKNKTKYIKIPDFIFNCSKEIISSYISGCIDSDGTVYETSFKYSTISKDYAYKYINLLQLLGYFPSISVQYREGREPLYEISDGFRRNQYLPTQSIKFNNKFENFTTNSKYRTPYTLENINLKAAETGVAHLKKISKKSEIGLYSYLDINNKPFVPIIYDEILEINPLGIKKVYDISLVEEHFFMCEGFYVSNSRKGALMISIDITHKEAETFITIKSDLNRINNANLSVEIDDDFMKIVEESYKSNTEIKMNCIRTYGSQTIEYDIIPIKLYKLLIKLAHLSAEPGVLFVNRFRNYNLMEFCDDYQIETCNPCGEQPLPKNGACNLGSINLSKYVIWGDKSFKYNEFVKDVKICVRGLDEIIDENLNNHALSEQREMSYNYRNIGLGVMGFADMFIKLGIIYGSEESLKLTDKIMKLMLKSAVEASVELAVEKGSFPKYRKELFDSTILKNIFTESELEEFKILGIRNCSLLSIAPTGSLGTMFNISTGIEPNFALEYIRKTESLEGNKESYHKVFAGIAEEYTTLYNTDKLPECFVTSHDINWRDRIKIQAVAQNYIDTAISATINLPEDITVEEVENLYLEAWKQGLKGVTIYRNNCRKGILSLTEEVNKQDNFFERGNILKAKVVHFNNEGVQWIAFIGIKNNKPFEIFSGPSDMELFPIPKSIKDGEIIKVKSEESTRYDFRYTDKYGYVNTLGGLSRMFNKEYWNYARLISGMFRNQVELDSIISIIDSMHSDSESLHSWKNGVIRSIKTFIEDGTETKEKCPECGGDMVYTGGCKQCNNCGWSKCN